MRIERVETFHFVGPVERPYGPSCAYSRVRDGIIVKLTADDGTVGWGETYAIGAVRATIDGFLGPMLIGRDPIDGRRLWSDLWGPNFGHGLAISAIDIALADLRGKALGLSLTRLYGGGFRERVPAYASGIPYYEGVDPEAYWVEDAVALAEQGFRAIKVRIGRYDPARELPLLARMREALPEDVVLMADANAAYTLHTALRVSRVLDELGFAWLEEPIREGDYEAFDVLTAQSPTPIAAGEILLDRSAASRFIARRGARIVQPDVSIIGGLAELLFVAETARLARISTVPHCNAGGITLAATLHLCALLPDPTAVPGTEAPMLELETPRPVFHTDLLRTPIAIDPADGMVAVPTGPGLGIDIDEDVLRRFSRD
jgi:D-galactarolactone cycloisomerase